MGLGTGITVLVVDDDGFFRQFVEGMLEVNEFAVIAADGAASAMRALEDGAQIDLLIVDLVMPVGSPHGFSIARMAQRQRTGLPVLYITGGEDWEFALRAEDDRVLKKPFDEEALLDAVFATLGRQRPESGTASQG